GLVVGLREVAVGVLVGAVGAIGARVGVAHGGPRRFPVEAGVAAAALPALLQLGFGFAPVAAAGLVPVFGAHAVGRRVVAVEVAVALVVVAAGGALAPVFDLGGRIDALGERLAARGAADRTDAAADQGADRPEEASDRSARDRARGTAGGDADGMRAGCAADGIAIGIGVGVPAVHVHVPALRGKDDYCAPGVLRTCRARACAANNFVRDRARSRAWCAAGTKKRHRRGAGALVSR